MRVAPRAAEAEFVADLATRTVDGDGRTESPLNAHGTSHENNEAYFYVGDTEILPAI